MSIRHKIVIDLHKILIGPAVLGLSHTKCTVITTMA